MKHPWLWASFVLLFVLHQDWWNWTDRDLVLGFLPAGLAYHAGFSVAAAGLWAAASRWAWPAEVEAWADRGGDEHAGPEARTGRSA